MYTIIIIEDDKQIREELEILLQNSGYKTISIEQFENVEKQVEKENAHLILLDVNLPQKSGFEICSKIRSKSKIPIIFVTSRNNAIDELQGIMLGGDDYIEKPYNVPVLLARISNLLNRSYPSDKKETKITYKGIQIDTLTGLATYQNKEVELTRNELKILYYLFQNTGKIIPRIDIVEYMWDNQMYIDDNTLSVHMTRIREKLQEIGVQNLIQTKRGQGYKL